MKEHKISTNDIENDDYERKTKKLKLKRNDFISTFF